MSLPTGRTPSMMTWEGDLVPPVTSYAASINRSAVHGNLGIPHSTLQQGSSVVNRIPRRNGLVYHYAHGGIRMPIGLAPTPGSGGVLSSAFQQVLVQLYDWSTNLAWFAAGYPRNKGLSFRVQQLSTNGISGAPGAKTMTMQPRPLVSKKVQRIPRASVVPPSYNTRGSNA